MVFRMFLPFQGVVRWLARRLPGGKAAEPGGRQSRQELSQMSEHELKDLGISRGDIPALFEDPRGWRRDRR